MQDLSDKFNTLQQAMASAERVFRLLDTHGRWNGRRSPGGTENDHAASVPRAAPSPRRQRGFHRVRGRVVRIRSRPCRPRGRPACVTRVGACRVWALKSSPERRWRSSATPGRGRRRSSTCCCASTIHSADGSSWMVYDVRALPALRTAFADRLRAAGHLPLRRVTSSRTLDCRIRLAKRRSRSRRAGGGGSNHSADAARLRATARRARRRRSAWASASSCRSRGRSRPTPRCWCWTRRPAPCDSEIEAEIRRALAVLMEGRTTIAIAHRLSTIVNADEILVLHHGHVHERGNHRQLMANAGCMIASIGCRRARTARDDALQAGA